MQKQFFWGVLLFVAFLGRAAERPELQVGVAGHAFDHLGKIEDQGVAAAIGGATIIYPAGFGAMGYGGLASTEELKNSHKHFREYIQRSKAAGIQRAIGYVCATSIVGLDKFDRNWPESFEATFSSSPSDWLQKDHDGNSLPSWYGGNYRPACMNNPDWRIYEKFIVRLQLESGHDGIFFDNPTVHPQGCYCEHCLKKFVTFLASVGEKIKVPKTNSVVFLRQLAASRTNEFLRFRSTIARDFLAEMSTYARSLNRHALVTCNNSLNSPESFFSQNRTHGYNIFEMSKAEDFVVVEDMANQPRVLADGTVLEYGHVYEMLHAISHGKPIVAVTLAEGDYHTPPNLVRLAMAEAVAHNASYLTWATWPEKKRRAMVTLLRPSADFLYQHAALWNGTEKTFDAILFLPFQRWAETAECHELNVARSLNAANVQFVVADEGNLNGLLVAHPRSIVIAESLSVLSPAEKARLEKFTNRGGKTVWFEKENWLTNLVAWNETPTVTVQAPPTVRVIVRDQPKKRIVHLLNLNVQRISSFEDKVASALDVRLKVRVPFAKVRSIKALSADGEATQGLIPFTFEKEKNGGLVELTIPRLQLATVLLIE